MDLCAPLLPVAVYLKAVFGVFVNEFDEEMEGEDHNEKFEKHFIYFPNRQLSTYLCNS